MKPLEEFIKFMKISLVFIEQNRDILKFSLAQGVSSNTSRFGTKVRSYSWVKSQIMPRLGIIFTILLHPNVDKADVIILYDIEVDQPIGFTLIAKGIWRKI